MLFQNQKTSRLLIVLSLFQPQFIYASISEFQNFTPLTASVAGGTLPDSAPLLLSSPNFTQETISANDRGVLNGGVKLGDNWDMITLNENGPEAGRYLFHPYESGAAGVKRLDLTTGESVSIVAEGTQDFVDGDASLWTPWGTYLTTEERWGTGSTKGRLFEITNPLDAPSDINFVLRNIIPRVSHEGIAFDKNNNFYFSDEYNGGSIYRYVSQTPNEGTTFFDAGQTSVLKIAGGGNYEVTGAGDWEPITNTSGVPLPGVPTVLLGSLLNQLLVIDGRLAADFVGGTGFNRPEDMQIQTLPNGNQYLYFATTASHKVFSMDISDSLIPNLRVFADQSTIDMATGNPVGDAMRNPDNLAIDADGNIYFLEDIGNIGVEGFDIWFAKDDDRDGVAESIGRWASLSTLNAEPSGLYFSTFDPNVAYLNVQHAGNDIDRTIQITATPASSVPEPGSLALFGIGLLALGFGKKRI